MMTKELSSPVLSSAGRRTREEMLQYWSDLSHDCLTDEDDGLGVICYAGMPAWFNRFLDVFQRKAFRRLLQDEDFTGKSILDVGTGVGRWARFFSAWPDTRVVGVDIEPTRLLEAQRKSGNVAYLEMPINSLAFPSGSFDVVNSVTVLQHVDHETKQQAMAEFARVLRPGGKAIVFEKTDLADDASHVYPWNNETWVREFSDQGFRLVRSVGDQYTPLIRLLRTAYRLGRGGSYKQDVASLRAGSANLDTRLTRLLLYCSVQASYPVEEVARLLPPRFAKITGSLFEMR